jgi:hypothetical protein
MGSDRMHPVAHKLNVQGVSSFLSSNSSTALTRVSGIGPGPLDL